MVALTGGFLSHTRVVLARPGEFETRPLQPAADVPDLGKATANAPVQQGQMRDGMTVSVGRFLRKSERRIKDAMK